VQESEADTTVKIRLVRGAETRELAVGIGNDPDGEKDRRVTVIKHLRQKAWMGVRLSSMDDDLAGYFRVKADEGALILGVEKDGPALHAGLKSGDVIVRLNKDKVYVPGDVVDIIGDRRPGDKIETAVI
jgi:serine protease Do